MALVERQAELLAVEAPDAAGVAVAAAAGGDRVVRTEQHGLTAPTQEHAEGRSFGADIDGSAAGIGGEQTVADILEDAEVAPATLLGREVDNDLGPPIAVEIA